jgi:hypothetical protein
VSIDCRGLVRFSCFSLGVSNVWAIGDNFIRFGDRLNEALDLGTVNFLNLLLIREILDLHRVSQGNQMGGEPKTCGQIVESP